MSWYKELSLKILNDQLNLTDTERDEVEQFISEQLAVFEKAEDIFTFDIMISLPIYLERICKIYNPQQKKFKPSNLAEFLSKTFLPSLMFAIQFNIDGTINSEDFPNVQNFAQIQKEFHELMWENLFVSPETIQDFLDSHGREIPEIFPEILKDLDSYFLSFESVLSVIEKHFSIAYLELIEAQLLSLIPNESLNTKNIISIIEEVYKGKRDSLQSSLKQDEEFSSHLQLIFSPIDAHKIQKKLIADHFFSDLANDLAANQQPENIQVILEKRLDLSNIKNKTTFNALVVPLLEAIRNKNKFYHEDEANKNIEKNLYALTRHFLPGQISFIEEIIFPKYNMHWMSAEFQKKMPTQEEFVARFPKDRQGKIRALFDNSFLSLIVNRIGNIPSSDLTSEVLLDLFTNSLKPESFSSLPAEELTIDRRMAIIETYFYQNIIPSISSKINYLETLQIDPHFYHQIKLLQNKYPAPSFIFLAKLSENPKNFAQALEDTLVSIDGINKLLSFLPLFEKEKQKYLSSIPFSYGIGNAGSLWAQNPSAMITILIKQKALALAKDDHHFFENLDRYTQIMEMTSVSDVDIELKNEFDELIKLTKSNSLIT